MASKIEAPEAVRIYHRKAGDSHIFTSPDLVGFHVGHPDLRKAFNMIAPAVGALVRINFGIQVEYEPDTTFEALKKSLNADKRGGAPEHNPLDPAIIAKVRVPALELC